MEKSIQIVLVRTIRFMKGAPKSRGLRIEEEENTQEHSRTRLPIQQNRSRLNGSLCRPLNSLSTTFTTRNEANNSQACQIPLQPVSEARRVASIVLLAV